MKYNCYETLILGATFGNVYELSRMYSFLGGVEVGVGVNLSSSVMSNSLHMEEINSNRKCMLNRELGHFRHICKETTLSG